jgi:hypothetical protein
MHVQPVAQTDQDGRGIFPDKEIIPTTDDRVKAKDPEMEYVVRNFK